MCKEVCGIYTIEYHSAIKKNYILPFAATWIDLESIMVSEMSDRESQIPRLLLFVEYKNKTENPNKSS